MKTIIADEETIPLRGWEFTENNAVKGWTTKNKLVTSSSIESVNPRINGDILLETESGCTYLLKNYK